MFRNVIRTMIVITLITLFTTGAFADTFTVTLTDSNTIHVGLDMAQEKTIELINNGEVEAGMTIIQCLGAYGDEYLTVEFGDQILEAADDLIIGGEAEAGIELQKQFGSYMEARTAAMERKAEREADKAEQESAAKTERESGWTTEIKPLSFEESLAWAETDSIPFMFERIEWLNERWVEKFGFTALDSGATSFDILANLEDQVEARNKQRKLISTINGQVKPLQKQIDAGADADLEFLGITAGMNLRLAKLEAFMKEFKAWRPTVESRFTVLRDSLNDGRVKIVACIELLKYAKYSSGPENSDMIDKALNPAWVAVKPIEFPMSEDNTN
ncbi:hypothetical protein KKA01_02175 [Patescibacteria group bacterium]|nr:hypothetical protein [Patescibacteria group bacterium]